MFEYDYENEDKELKLVGLELMFLKTEKYSNPEGITEVKIKKRVGLSLDIVKKKLKILYDNEIIRCSGLNPKFWKFDEYKYQRLDEDNEIYRLLCSFDDVDFDRYFSY